MCLADKKKEEGTDTDGGATKKRSWSLWGSSKQAAEETQAAEGQPAAVATGDAAQPSGSCFDQYTSPLIWPFIDAGVSFLGRIGKVFRGDLSTQQPAAGSRWQDPLPAADSKKAPLEDDMNGTEEGTSRTPTHMHQLFRQMTVGLHITKA